MAPKKILLLGAQGQVGKALHVSLAESHTVVPLSRAELDLGDLKTTEKKLIEYKPDIVINAAAYTAVDQAEIEFDIARRVNADAPGVIAETAHQMGAVMIHFSTDYVFDGKKKDPYTENDIPNPLSVYGQTKWQGDQNVAAACLRHYIFRAGWIYSTQQDNFLFKIIRLATRRASLQIVSDQYGTPTPASHLVYVISSFINSLDLDKHSPIPWGTYHTAPKGMTSWYEYAAYAVNRSRSIAKDLKFADVHPLASGDYPTKAVRPTNGVLDTRKTQAALNVDFAHWTNYVDDHLNQIIAKVKDCDPLDDKRPA